jgi:hypothetical protein
MKFWVEHAGQRGLPPEMLGLLLVDENKSPEQDRRVIQYGEIIHAASPEVLVWQDPAWPDPRKAAPRMFEVSNVLVPSLGRWISGGKDYRSFYGRLHDAGHELAFYSPHGQSRLLDPYAHYLMQEWWCWRSGAKGSYFWAFSDSGGASSWNEYNAKAGAATPLFLDAQGATSAKQLEAIREGVEDYEYLRMLSAAVGGSRKADGSADAAAARELLQSGPQRVTDAIDSVSMLKWEVDKDRSVADQVRAQVLEMLTRLGKGQSQAGASSSAAVAGPVPRMDGSSHLTHAR